MARSGREALDLADHQRDIRLVVTDVVMPEMSGPELVEQLSRRAPELTSIFVSGHASDILAAHGVQERDIVLLHKPFTRSELLRTVSLALGESARSDTDT